MKKTEYKKRKNILSIIVFVIILTLIVGSTIYAVTSNNKKTIETDGEVIDSQLEENLENIEETENNINEITNETNEVTNEISKEKDVSNKKDNISVSNQNKYYIKINNTANVVTIYTYDDNGKYTKPVKAMVCSTGKATPQSGKYKLNGTKHRWHTLFGNVYGQYTTAIVGNILFHSVPYTVKGDPSSLEYWEYDKLGTRASAGCIRLTVTDAQWIYNNISKGTTVEFYSDSNPGPLGKPSAQKISGDADRRGWDPTDPDSKNPWKLKQNQQTTQSQPAPAQPAQKQPDTSTQPKTPTESGKTNDGDTQETDSSKKDNQTNYNQTKDSQTNDSQSNNNQANGNQTNGNKENSVNINNIVTTKDKV